MADNISTQLVDATIQAQIDLERLSASETIKVKKLLNKLKDDITARIAIIDPLKPRATIWRQKRLEKLLKHVDELISNTFKTIKNSQKAALVETAKYQSAKEVKVINDLLGVDMANVKLTTNRLRSLVNKSMIDGHFVGEWWNGQSNKFREKFTGAMNIATQEFQLGVARGDTIAQLVRGFTGTADIMGLTAAKAEALIHTSFMQVASDARFETYQQNIEMFKVYYWNSTLDVRTTPGCKALDRKMWDAQTKEPLGHKFIFRRTPRHWRCRSSLMMLLKSYEELKKIDPSIDPGKRASMTGPVRADMDYNSWLKRQPKKTQIEALGINRRKIWKDRGLSMSQMVNQQGNPITLKELYEKYGMPTS